MAVTHRLIALNSAVGTALLRVTYCTGAGCLVKTFAALWLAQFLAWLVWSVVIYPFYVSPLRFLPQPTGYRWLIGHTVDIDYDAREWVTDIKHGHFIRFLGPFNEDSLLPTSPEAISEILVSKNYQFPRSAVSKFALGRYTGHGIGIADGAEHKAQRRALVHAFSSKHVKARYQSFWDKGCESARAMACAGDGEGKGKPPVVDINSWAKRCAIDIASAVSTGVEFGATHDQQEPWDRLYSRLGTLCPSDVLLILLGSWSLPESIVSRLPLRRNREVNNTLSRIEKAVRTGIQKNKNLELGKEQANPNIYSLTRDVGGFSDSDMVEQLKAFIFAGQQAVARTLTGAIYGLCLFPEKQDTLRREIRDRLLPALGANGEIRSADVDDMPYLHAVCKEALRKFSTGKTTRVAACDVTVQGQFIPKGATIVMATLANSTDPLLWGPDAGDFKPERWLHGAQDKCAETDGCAGGCATGGAGTKYAFMPFMHGPQGCIAHRFAQSEVACILAAWISRFRFELEDMSLMDERNLPRYALQSRFHVVLREVGE